MTEAYAQQLICKAALLEDSEASEFLHQQLNQLAEWSEGSMELLLAFAWLAPQKARDWYTQSAVRAPEYHPIQEWLGQLLEAQQLIEQGAEVVLAHSTMTALLPNSPELHRRLQILWLARAMSAPERILEDPDWYRYLTNPFLRARMWKWFPKEFWEQLQNHRMLVRGSYPVGQLVLAGLGESGNLPLLFKITLARNTYAEGIYRELEVFALLAALDALEQYHPRELKSASHSLFYAIPTDWGPWDGPLIARLLVLIARLDLESGTLLRPIVVRIAGVVDACGVRRWARTIDRDMMLFGPVPESARQLARVVRLLALMRYIVGIVRNGQASWPGDIARVQRWLERSERIIASLSERGWRDYFYAKRSRLQVKG